MLTRMTRRQALAVGAVAALAGRTDAASLLQDDANKSWVGKIVMPKKYATTGAPPNRDGAVPPDLAIPLYEASYAVKGEKDNRVELFVLDGRVCWVEKEQLVLLSDAVEFFSKALKANEKDTFALTSRGWAFYLLGKPVKAIADFDAFLKITAAGVAVPPGIPARWEGLANRGLVYAEEGEFEKALKDLDEAVTGWPVTAPIARVNRGYTYSLMGEYEKAIADYKATPDMLSFNNYAWLQATCPDAKFRDAAEAVKLAKFLCDRTDNREGVYLDTLAAAYAEDGKFDEAVKAQEKALADKSFAERYGEDAKKRLKLYKDKKPFRTEPVKK